MIFAIMVTICFAACDDKDDSKQETNTCTPATCEMVEHATEMGCDDAGHCIVKACADTFKVAEDAKSCETDAPACTCDPACKDDEDCIKGEDGTCGCRAKDITDKCDPKCEGDTKCECTMDACACVPVTPAPTCEPACNDETEDCLCDADKCECRAKDAQPDPSATEDACQSKSENDACGENKTCQKGEGDKLECKDKPADPAPAE